MIFHVIASFLSATYRTLEVGEIQGVKFSCSDP